MPQAVEEYIRLLPEDRRSAIHAVRDVILKRLPDGYKESMSWGMITYEVPLERFPHTYNGKPLAYISLASQKSYMSLHLMCLYADPQAMDRFQQRYAAAGKKLNMGKSCLRFKKLDDLPLDVIGDVVASVSVEDYIAQYRVARERPAEPRR